MLRVILGANPFAIYPPVIKRGHGKSPINGGFNGTIPYKWEFSSNPCLMTPEGIDFRREWCLQERENMTRQRQSNGLPLSPQWLSCMPWAKQGILLIYSVSIRSFTRRSARGLVPGVNQGMALGFYISLFYGWRQCLHGSTFYCYGCLTTPVGVFMPYLLDLFFC